MLIQGNTMHSTTTRKSCDFALVRMSHIELLRLSDTETAESNSQGYFCLKMAQIGSVQLNLAELLKLTQYRS